MTRDLMGYDETVLMQGSDIIDEDRENEHNREVSRMWRSRKRPDADWWPEGLKQANMTHWGRADTIKRYGAGIFSVSTPSHGGFILSPERMAEMPKHLRLCSYTGNNLFEEDTAWCAVMLAFPREFDDEQITQAKQFFQSVYANKPEIKAAMGVANG